MATSTQGYPGQIGLTTYTSEHNLTDFHIQQALSRVRTMQIVQVVGSSSAGQIAPAGFLNVTLLVNQVDGVGNSTVHGKIYQIPYIRMQGGTSAVILDPQVGDIGWCGFADRDISPIVRSRIMNNFPFLGSVINRFNPGSRRKFSASDGVYIGGILNGTPTQYVSFAAGGISVTSPTAITLTAPTVTINASTAMNTTAPNITLAASTKVELNTPAAQIDGNLTSGAGAGSSASFNGTLTTTGEITANGHTVGHHTHAGVQSGSSATATPTG